MTSTIQSNEIVVGEENDHDMASKLSQEEIKSAFSFLDMDKTGQVSMANLKKRLGIFFPGW